MRKASIADITRKTVFFIAAVLGRRVSNIHALSIAEEHLEFSGDALLFSFGQALSLRIKPWTLHLNLSPFQIFEELSSHQMTAPGWLEP